MRLAPSINFLIRFVGVKMTRSKSKVVTSALILALVLTLLPTVSASEARSPIKRDAYGNWVQAIAETHLTGAPGNQDYGAGQACTGGPYWGIAARTLTVSWTLRDGSTGSTTNNYGPVSGYYCVWDIIYLVGIDPIRVSSTYTVRFESFYGTVSTISASVTDF